MERWWAARGPSLPSSRGWEGRGTPVKMVLKPREREREECVCVCVEYIITGGIVFRAYRREDNGRCGTPDATFRVEADPVRHRRCISLKPA